MSTYLAGQSLYRVSQVVQGPCARRSRTLRSGSRPSPPGPAALWTASGLRSDLTKAWRSRGSWSRTAPDRLTTGRRPPDMSLTPLVAFILPAWPVYGCTGAQRGL